MGGFSININSGGSQPGGCAAKVMGTIFGLIFAGLGAAFVVMILRGFWQNQSVRGWTKTPCTIIRAVAEEPKTVSEGQYGLSLSYSYEAGGAKRTGTVYAPQYDGSDDYADVAHLADELRTREVTTCLVNPARPSEAVLTTRTGWGVLVAPFPLIFVAVGVGVIWGVWRKGTGTGQSAGPISARATRGQLTGKVVLVVVLLVGLGVFAGLIVPILARWASARSWPAVPCVIERSGVRTYPGDSDSGPTYSVAVLYRYAFADQQHKSSRYGLVVGSSSGEASKRQVVRQIPPGAHTTCYVNPADPYAAVLDRSLSWLMLLGLIPLAMVAIGVIGLRAIARKERESAGGAMSYVQPGTRTPLFRGRPQHDQPVGLRPASSPAAKLIGVTFFALFWNGIVSIFVYVFIQGWRSGHGEVCLGVFLIPFVVVGLVVLAMVPVTLLSMFNPRVQMTLARGAVRLGESVDMKWEFTGRYDRITRLLITLTGREEATYTRGTSTVTDKHEFAAMKIAERTKSFEIRAGTARISIPADTMHSFSASNNKIIWAIAVHGEMPNWPDVKENFNVEVLPAAVAGAAS